MSSEVIIISESASFPWGMAAANRVRNLARALLLDGCSVEYLGMRGAEVSGKSELFTAPGIEVGILYSYPGRFTVRPGNWWLRRVDDVCGWVAIIWTLISRKFSGNVDVVILYSRNEKVAGFLIPFIHALKIPVILEMCEWPLALAEVNGRSRKKADKYCQKIVPTADAILPISSYIEGEIKELAKAKGKKIPSFKIPILIDIEGDDIQIESTDKGYYMLYCGSFNYMDIAKIVVDIVHFLQVQNIRIPVIFTGKENPRRLAELQRYAEQQGVLELFTFTGFIEESELHHLMQEAVCLLAPLPENLQSESRFSTKIGYYLASGTPVVTNRIGDVRYYLQDGENAYVVTHCDPRQYAKKIAQVLADSEASLEIGRAGRALAFNNFHYSKACRGFGDFVDQIVNEYKES